MSDMKSRLRGFTDRKKWAAHGTSFMTKAKATRSVWFPPKAAQTGKKTTSKATKKATKRVPRRAS